MDAAPMNAQDSHNQRSPELHTSGANRAAPSAAWWTSAGLYAALVIACIVWIILAPRLTSGAALSGQTTLIQWLGALALVITLALAPIALRRQRADDAFVYRAEALRRLDALKVAIEAAANEAGLTEAAKRVLHRKEERQLLRRAIEQDIADRDWDAAMILVKELAERFGYRADAEEFRARIERARAETLDREVLAAMETLEAHMAEHRWSDALREAERITRVFPDSARVDGVRERVVAQRERYKAALERQFLEAAERDQTERAMELLRELDAYLTEAQAEPLREVARGVIGRARDNLGVRFKLLVQDRAWADAVRVGEQIIEQFPNSRMAVEVRDVIDSLREKAATARRAATA